MLGWMDDEALARTLATGRATYWSRSRGEYWAKGETSGHRQWVRGGQPRLRRRHRAAPGRPGGPGLPHRHAHLLRRRPGLGDRTPTARRMADGRRLFGPAVLAGLVGSGLARARRRQAVGRARTAGPARRSSTTPAATSRWPRRSAWSASPAGASCSSPAAGYAAWSPSWARWSRSAWSSTAVLGRSSALDSARARHRRPRPHARPGRTSPGWWWVGPRRLAVAGPRGVGARRAVLRRAGPRWAAGTTRPPARRRPQDPADMEDVDLWRAIDQGRDPTDPTDH